MLIFTPFDVYSLFISLNVTPEYGIFSHGAVFIFEYSMLTWKDDIFIVAIEGYLL